MWEGRHWFTALYGRVDRDVWMRQPDGRWVYGDGHHNDVDDPGHPVTYDEMVKEWRENRFYLNVMAYWQIV